jgi:fructose-1,6-bisphosphatase
MYGNILGCHCLPGKAYIQYSNSSEADFAVSTLNGYLWKGTVLGLFGFFLETFKSYYTTVGATHMKNFSENDTSMG